MITQADIASVIEKPPLSGEGGSTVDVKLTDSGTVQLTALTTDASTQSAPQNQLAIVLGTRVVSAPSVEAPVPGSQLQIAGGLTEEEAQTIAGEIQP